MWMVELLAFFLLIQVKKWKTGAKTTVSEEYTVLPEYNLTPNSSIGDILTNLLRYCLWAGMDPNEF